MSGIKAFCRAAMRIGIALLVLGVGLFAASCGKDGSIYGEVTWDYTLYYASLGGFPSHGYASTYYTISAGTYNVYYTLQWWDGAAYEYSPGVWVSDPYNPAWYWKSTYTVEADKGSFPLVNGKDHYFSLYMSWDGMVKSGDVNYIETPAQHSKSSSPKLGTQSWTEDGLLITVKNEIVKLSPEDLLKIGKTQMEKK